MMNEKAKSPSVFAIALSKAWGNHFPVNVHQIAMEVSGSKPDPISKIDSLPIPPNAFEGALLKKGGGKKWGIVYSDQIREKGKVNFTIAHEFGHYLLHRDKNNQIACTGEELRDFPHASKPASNIEQEANEFASYLLMPINDFRSQINGNSVDISLIGHCANRYDTSLTASALKLIDFTDRAVVVIVSEGGKIKWSRSSLKALKHRRWFKKGTPIPTKSVTMKCIQSGNVYNTAQAALVEGKTWSSHSDVLESAIAQPYYKSVFTILDFPD